MGNDPLELLIKVTHISTRYDYDLTGSKKRHGLYNAREFPLGERRRVETGLKGRRG